MNVRDLGAVGDGRSHPLSERYASLADAQADYPHASSLDAEIDWATIQAAINIAGACGGGTVFFPKGTFRTTSRLTVSSADIGLLGDAQAEIHLTVSAENTCALEVRASGFTAEKLTFRGPSPDAYTLNEHGIWAHGDSSHARLIGFNVLGCEFFGFGSDGIRAQFINQITETDNYFRDLGYAGTIHASCNDGVFARNRVKTITPGTASHMYGISLNHDSTNYHVDQTINPGCDRWLIAHNDIEEINWAGIDGHLPSNVKVIGNHVRSCRYGIGIDTGSGDARPFTGFNIDIIGNISEGGTRPNNTPSGASTSEARIRCSNGMSWYPEISCAGRA